MRCANRATRCHALRQRVDRSSRHLDDVDAFFGETIELPAERVELAVGGDDARTVAQRECREPSRDELVRVLAERDVRLRCRRASRAKPARTSCGLDGRALPLVVDELRGVEPGALLRLEADVRPRLVRVAGEQQPLADAEARVVLRERILGQSSVSRSWSPVPVYSPVFSNPESRIPSPKPESRAPVLLSPSTQEAS